MVEVVELAARRPRDIVDHARALVDLLTQRPPLVVGPKRAPRECPLLFVEPEAFRKVWDDSMTLYAPHVEKLKAKQ